jgi:hypothetical protein
MTRTKLTPTQTLNTVSSQANAGTAGGTIYYINLGGIKIAWGQTAAITVAAGGGAAGNVTLPTSFFSTIQQVMSASSDNTGIANVYGSVDQVVAASFRIVLTNTGGGSTNAKASFMVIGT